MGAPFIGEIRMVAYNFPPRGWAFCDGQLLGIPQNQALFSILGTIYGGNGQTNFGLPDLRGRIPISWGLGRFGTVALGQRGGEAQHTLINAEMPAHNHPMIGATNPGADARAATGNYLGLAGTSWYNPGAPNTTLDPAAVTFTGGGQPHDNMQPYLCVNFAIALVGLFPSQN